MRLALLSDVHANLADLEAALDHIKAAGVDGRYGLGDSTSALLESRRTAIRAPAGSCSTRT